ncbi:MAG: hypothetical protein LBC74_15665 [Planctomycetaceae bacterium]|jgi:hypothetical protein|nr:hypothetical protein [Planctomycetaceae bacterium]
MIEFTCPDCGKFYSVSERFAGRRMVCADCKNNITVPESSTIQTPPPTSVSPPSLPVSPLFSNFELESSPDKVDFEQQPAEEIITPDAAETALLAAVFTDKMQDKRDANIRSKIPPPSPSKKIETIPDKKFPLRDLIIIVTIISILLGTAIYFIFIFDWLGPDMRVELLKQLEERQIKTTIAIGNKDSEIEALRVRSLGSWSSTCDAIDTFIMTIGEIDIKNRDVLELDWNIALDTIDETGKQQLAAVRDEIKNSIPAAEMNLSKLKLQAVEDAAKAEADELATDTAIKDASNLRAELRFYETEIAKLKKQIAESPHERPMVSFPIFDKETLPPRDSIARLDIDWTEEYYNQFKFFTAHQNNYFTTFDGMRRLFGNRSLRITLFERAPITIHFPDSNRTKSELNIARTFSFAMRFPDLTDAIMVGEERDTGQFREIQIRFINNAGYIDFKTKSHEYCDAVFYSGRGKFVAIEFSLEGNEFWNRSDNFDKVKLSEIIGKNEKREFTEEEIKAMIDEVKASEREREAKALEFFNQIDRVEFRLTPASNRTTFWIDGIAFADNLIRTKFDLVLANSLKRELQELEREKRKKRRQRSALISLSQIKGFQNRQQPEQPDIDPNSPDAYNNPNNSKINYESDDKTTNKITDPSKTSTTKSDVENKREKKPIAATDNRNVVSKSKETLFKWVLSNAKGRIKANYGGRVFTFGHDTKIPNEVEKYEIEQISISNFKITEQQLDHVINFKSIKRLVLDNVGLKNSDVVKLSVLDSLELLNLANNQLTFEALPALKTLRKLRELDVTGIRMSVEGIDALGAIRSLVNLNLSNSGFDSTDLNYCITLTNLEVLNLSGTKVGDRVTGIMQLLGKLREVDLSRTRISNNAINSLIDHNGIEILRLDAVELDDNCLEAIDKIKNLKSVSAKKTKITNEGIKQKINNKKIKFDL